MPITPIRPDGTINQLLANDGNGGLANVNIGENLAYNTTTKTLSAPGGGGGGAVNSVFNRTGDVVAENGDYEASQVTNDSDVDNSNGTVADALDWLNTNKAGVADSFYDGIVDGIGGTPNHYAKWSLAIADGKTSLKVTGSITEDANITFAKSVRTFIDYTGSLSFVEMQVTLAGFAAYFAQNDSPANSKIFYQQSTPNTPLFTDSGQNSILSVAECGVDMSGVTASGCPLASINIIQICDNTSISVGNAENSGVNWGQQGTTANGCELRGSGANSQNFYINGGCLISNLELIRGSSTQNVFFTHSSPDAITDQLKIDTNVSNVSCQIQGALRNVVLDTGGSLSLLITGSIASFTNVDFGAAGGTISSVGGLTGVVFENNETDGTYLGDPTDSNFYFSNNLFNSDFSDSAEGSKVVNNIFGAQANFEGANAQLSNNSFEDLLCNGANAIITGCRAGNSFAGTEVASSIRVGNDSIIGNTFPQSSVIVDKTSALAITSGTILDIGSITLGKGDWWISFSAAITDTGGSSATLTDLKFWIDTVSGNAGSLDPCVNGLLGVAINTFSISRDLPVSFSGMKVSITTTPVTYYLKAYATGTLFTASTKVYGRMDARG